MPITYCSNGLRERERIKAFLREQKQLNPAYKVIDIGGHANPWCDEFVDAYVDILPHPTKTTFVGDINEPEVWARIGATQWDFSICTHTLEDIRDPKVVIGYLQRVSRAGFISMPNKHTELANIESPQYVGYCHHRWIFQISPEGKLRALAKLGITQRLKPRNLLTRAVTSVRLWIRANIRGKHAKRLPEVRWIDRSLATHEAELALMWEHEIPFEYVNGDFPGASCHELARLYTEEIAPGL